MRNFPAGTCLFEVLATSRLITSPAPVVRGAEGGSTSHPRSFERGSDRAGPFPVRESVGPGNAIAAVKRFSARPLAGNRLVNWARHSSGALSMVVSRLVQRRDRLARRSCRVGDSRVQRRAGLLGVTTTAYRQLYARTNNQLAGPVPLHPLSGRRSPRPRWRRRGRCRLER